MEVAITIDDLLWVGARGPGDDALGATIRRTICTLSLCEHGAIAMLREAPRQLEGQVTPRVEALVKSRSSARV